jgi:hypothetical protein
VTPGTKLAGASIKLNKIRQNPVTDRRPVATTPTTNDPRSAMKANPCIAADVVTFVPYSKIKGDGQIVSRKYRHTASACSNQ